MEAEGQLGVRLVFDNGVLEVFSHGVSSLRLTPGGAVQINRIPRKNCLALSIRGGHQGALVAFTADQAPAAENVLPAFESSA